MKHPGPAASPGGTGGCQYLDCHGGETKGSTWIGEIDSSSGI